MTSRIKDDKKEESKKSKERKAKMRASFIDVFFNASRLTGNLNDGQIALDKHIRELAVKKPNDVKAIMEIYHQTLDGIFESAEEAPTTVLEDN